jgi:hypothetical protein
MTNHTRRRTIGLTITIAIAVAVLSAPAPVLAATKAAATPSTQPTSAGTTAATDSADIEQLKERLATKVAELRTLVKRAMFGTVKDVSVASATVETSTKDIKIELGDNVGVAQMIGGKRTTLTTDQISVGDPLTVFGTYDETLDLLKAQFIFIESPIVTHHISGTVTATDAKGFTLTIATPEGRTIIVDVEKTTKANAWNATDGIAKSGFSKIAVGDTVHVAGIAEPKQDDHISANRILDLGDITGAAPSPTATLTVVASVSATPKSSVKPTSIP